MADTSKFPAPPFRVTLSDSVSSEIVEVTSVNGNVWTIARAQEGTIARSWNVGTQVELRWTAGMYDEIKSVINNNRVSKNSSLLTVWVDPVNGSDSNSGTQTLPVRTLNKALELLPDYIALDCTVNVLPGTISESITDACKNLSQLARL